VVDRARFVAPLDLALDRPVADGQLEIIHGRAIAERERVDRFHRCFEPVDEDLLHRAPGHEPVTSIETFVCWSGNVHERAVFLDDT
jgi:hypothetical protein